MARECQEKTTRWLDMGQNIPIATANGAAHFTLSSHADGERLAARVAFVEAGPSSVAVRLANSIYLAAVAANRSGRLKLRRDIGNSRFLVMEQRLGHN